FLDRFRIERVTIAVAAAEEDQFFAVHNPHGRRAPLSVKNARADLGVVFRDEFAGLLVQGNQAGRVRRGDVDVGPVLAIGGAGEYQVVQDEHGTVRSVVGEDAQFVHHVIDPDDIGVLRPCLGLGFAGADDVLRFVHVGAVVAVGHAFGVQADDFTAAGDQIDAIGLHGR